MGDLDRISQRVLSEEELAMQMQVDGATDAEIDAVLAEKAAARMLAQARYDKAPPKYYRPVKP